jgi:hypothetical protein
MNGICTGLPFEGFGILKWSVCNDNNDEVDLYIKDAPFVPTAPMGSLCPQQITQQTGVAGDGFNSLASNGVLRFQGFQRIVSYETRTRLPIFHTMECSKALTATIATNAPAPHHTVGPNLSNSQQLLLRWHYPLSHMNFSKLKELAQLGKLPKQIKKCEHPICARCQYEKAQRQLSPAATKPIQLIQRISNWVIEFQ